jgi:integrase
MKPIGTHRDSVTEADAHERLADRLAEVRLGIWRDPDEPAGAEALTAHGLRRTNATLCDATCDEAAYASAQLGHTDATFTMNV